MDISFGVSLIGGFFEHIISSLTNDNNNEYRVVIDRLDKHYIDNTDTIRELCTYPSKRLSTEVEDNLADVFIQQITKQAHQSAFFYSGINTSSIVPYYNNSLSFEKVYCQQVYRSQIL